MPALHLLQIEAEDDDPARLERVLRHAGYRFTMVDRVATGDAAGGARAGNGASGAPQSALALQESEARRRTLFDSLDAAVVLMDGARAIDCNPATLRLFGLSSREEFIGTTALDFATPAQPDGTNSAERIAAILQAAAQTGTQVFEWQAQRKTGDVFLMEVHVTPFTIGDGRFFQCVAFDITERTRLEQALREAEGSLRMAAEGAKVAIWKADLLRLRIRFSSAWKCVLGRDEEELPLTALWDLVHPDDRAKSAAAIQRHVQGAVPIYETEQRMLHVDGSYRWVLSRGVVARDAQGRPAGLMGADIDITERKTLEEALRRSEERYRCLVEDITDVIYAADQNGRVTYMSPVAESLYGYAPAEVIDRHFSEFIVPDDLAMVVDGFRGAIAGTPQPHDHRVVTKSGTVSWVRNHARPIWEDGQIVGLRGVLSDITERRQLEDALRDARTSLDLAATAARVGLWDWDLQTGHTDYADSWRRLFGHSAAELDGSLAQWASIVHPDDLEGVTRNTLAAIEARSTSYEQEFRIRHRDGDYRWVLSRASVLRDAAGQPTRMLGAHVDISERKRAEDAARRSARQLQAIWEASVENIAIVEDDGTLRAISPSVRAQLGYDAGQLLGRRAIALVHPDDHAAVRADFAGLVAQTAPGATRREFRVRHADGSWVWVESTLTNLLGDPDVGGLLVTTRDITERRQTFAASLLTEREAESARIAREIHDVLGQGLTALRMDAAWLETRLSTGDDHGADPLVLQRVRVMAGHIESNIASMRRIATELRPPILDGFGLVPALEWQAEEFQAHSGIRCEFRAVDVPEPDPNHAIVVLRILQEALTNVARHAQATRVVVHLGTEPGFLCLEVRDNGRGIDEHHPRKAPSLGLRNMRDRASLAGGRIDIMGIPGRGTTVILRLPWPALGSGESSGGCGRDACVSSDVERR